MDKYKEDSEEISAFKKKLFANIYKAIDQTKKEMSETISLRGAEACANELSGLWMSLQIISGTKI